jgi:hypothetical protein
MSEEYGFQGVWIPATLWKNKELSLTEKCLIVEIDNLAKNEAPCFASSEYLASFMNMEPGSIRNMLSDLAQRGHVIQLGSNGRTTWRCVNPLYTANIGKYRKWLEPSESFRLHEKGIAAITNFLTVLSPKSDTEIKEEIKEETLRSSHRASLSEKNSERGGFSQAKKEKKQRLTLEFVLDAVRPDLTLQSPSFVDAWKRWVEYRLQVRNPSVPGFQLNMAKFAVMGQARAIAAIDNSIGNGYQGLFEPGPQPRNKRSESCL